MNLREQIITGTADERYLLPHSNQPGSTSTTG